MKQILFSFLLACIVHPALKAQEVNIMDAEEEELLKLLENPSTPEPLRLEVLNELAYDFWNTPEYRDAAIGWAQEALALAKKLDAPRGESSALNRLGLLADSGGQQDSALIYFKQALDIRLGLGLKRGAASIYNNLGNLFKRQEGKAEKAVEYYLSGLEVLGGEDVNSDGARLHNNLGGLYTTMGDYSGAGHHLDQARRIYESLNSDFGRALNLINKGIYYQALNNHTVAKQSFQESLMLLRGSDKEQYIGKCYNSLGNHYFYSDSFNRALLYYDSALQLKKLEADDLASVIRNKGAIFVETGRLDSAFANFQYGLNAFEKMGDQREIADIHFNLGRIYAEKGDYKAAIQQYEKSLEMLEALQLPALRSNVLLHLSIAHQEEGELRKALRYNNQHLLLRDSLEQNMVAGLNQEVNLEKAYNQALLKLSREERQKLIYFGLIGFLAVWLLFMGAAFYAFINRKREQVARLELEDALNHQELERAYAYIDGRDEERQRIGQDLHDRLGSMLAMAKMKITSLDAKIEAFQAENRQQFEKGTELLDHAVDELREISYNLISGIIVKFGLKAQLEATAEDLRETGRLKVELSTHGLQERLNSKLEIQIYRIIQELTANVVKYANAKKLTLQVNRFNGVVNIMVEDDGRGFDLERAVNDGGMGLKSVESRVNKLDGELKIDTAKGRGTTVMIDIPVQEN